MPRKKYFWRVVGDDVTFHRSLADVVGYYGWGGLYAWRTRRGLPDDFEYRGYRVVRECI